jgi:hypothetical protein
MSYSSFPDVQLHIVDAPLGAGSESIRPIVVMDSGPITKPVLGRAFARPVGAEPLALSWLRYCPTGKSVNCLSSPICKNISVPALPKSLLYPPPSRPMKGRIAIVTDAGRDAVDAAASGDVRGWQGGSTRPVS